MDKWDNRGMLIIWPTHRVMSTEVPWWGRKQHKETQDKSETQNTKRENRSPCHNPCDKPLMSKLQPSMLKLQPLRSKWHPPWSNGYTPSISTSRVLAQLLWTTMSSWGIMRLVPLATLTHLQAQKKVLTTKTRWTGHNVFKDRIKIYRIINIFALYMYIYKCNLSNAWEVVGKNYI
jgi:hypothetical protein